MPGRVREVASSVSRHRRRSSPLLLEACGGGGRRAATAAVGAFRGEGTRLVEVPVGGRGALRRHLRSRTHGHTILKLSPPPPPPLSPPQTTHHSSRGRGERRGADLGGYPPHGHHELPGRAANLLGKTRLGEGAWDHLRLCFPARFPAGRISAPPQNRRACEYEDIRARSCHDS